jgi:ribosomal protein L37E
VPATTASCPRCGTAAAAEAAQCGECGFVFFERPARRSLPWPSPAWAVGALLVLAGSAAGVVLLTRDSPPEPPAPVPVARAEVLLARQLDAGPAASVRCTGPIRSGRATRCQFLYPDGDTQLMLVTLSPRGELDIDVPYPAQRRPGR